jgi:hypothetical protein
MAPITILETPDLCIYVGTDNPNAIGFTPASTASVLCYDDYGTPETGSGGNPVLVKWTWDSTRLQWV